MNLLVSLTGLAISTFKAPDKGLYFEDLRQEGDWKLTIFFENKKDAQACNTALTDRQLVVSMKFSVLEPESYCCYYFTVTHKQHKLQS